MAETEDFFNTLTTTGLNKSDPPELSLKVLLQVMEDFKSQRAPMNVIASPFIPKNMKVLESDTLMVFFYLDTGKIAVVAKPTFSLSSRVE